MKTEREINRRVLETLEAEKIQLQNNTVLLAALGNEIRRVGPDMVDSYECGSELGRMIVRLSGEKSRERDFLYDTGIRIIESLGGEEFVKDAKKYFDILFPVKFVLEKEGVDLGE